ncbi:hypothetical protein H206_06969 [Candidatus Electrothrix aarhusensis]|uniref:Uncharacterized protein n=1 Tax=Candidatus Electrothrix aarhusensis TaxID=1859131 RepID=A0A3S3RTN4_9BACT|nr:hypothetical protein H206_06969 [Candidatus Electrothrix aarhusensis]
MSVLNVGKKSTDFLSLNAFAYLVCHTLRGALQ